MILSVQQFGTWRASWTLDIEACSRCCRPGRLQISDFRGLLVVRREYLKVWDSCKVSKSAAAWADYLYSNLRKVQKETKTKEKDKFEENSGDMYMVERTGRCFLNLQNELGCWYEWLCSCMEFIPQNHAKKRKRNWSGLRSLLQRRNERRLSNRSNRRLAELLSGCVQRGKPALSSALPGRPRTCQRLGKAIACIQISTAGSWWLWTTTEALLFFRFSHQTHCWKELVSN